MAKQIQILSSAPLKLKGSLTLPPSKSQTLRAIVFAFLASGTSEIKKILESPDTAAMIEAVKLLGARVTIKKDTLWIEGVAGKPSVADDVINCGNSGLVLRLIGAIAGLIPEYTLLTGDASIRHKRPIKPLLSALAQLGAIATSARGDDHAPIIIKGPIRKSHAMLDGQDSQPVSGLLIAAAFAPHPITLNVESPGEKPWIDLTLDWFKRLNIPYEATDYTSYKLEGNSQIKAFSYTVPGDLSTAAFPIAAALLTKSSLLLHNVDLTDPQGDKKLIFLLQEMGASFQIDPLQRTLLIKKSSDLTGMDIDLNDCIDALPIMAVIGCFTKTPLTLTNATIARKKESDRISSITSELKKMGAHIEEQPDGMTIYPVPLQGADMQSHGDHRIAMSLSIAALLAKGTSTIKNADCISKTYPDFCKDLNQIGAEVKIL